MYVQYMYEKLGRMVSNADQHVDCQYDDVYPENFGSIQSL